MALMQLEVGGLALFDLDTRSLVRLLISPYLHAVLKRLASHQRRTSIEVISHL